MISVKQAQELLKKFSPRMSGEVVSLQNSVGRVLNSDVKAEIDHPLFDHSSMDGYALKYDSLAQGTREFVVSEEIPAGNMLRNSDASCLRIFTGAPVPDGFDCVIKQEDVTRLSDNTIKLNSSSFSKGDNIRYRAEDLKAGMLLFSKGTRITVPVQAVLATQGQSKIQVGKIPSIGYILSGNELCFSKEELKPGGILSCNGEIFESLLKGYGNCVKNLGHVKDDFAALKNAVESSDCDVTLISGGSSVGDYDFSKKVLEELGYIIHFTRLAIKPGKPLIFATKGSKVVFGVPGNPVSTFVSLNRFIRPCLRIMAGEDGDNTCSLTVPATLDSDFSKPAELEVYVRVSLKKGKNGAIFADTRLNQNSNALYNLAVADGLARLESGCSFFEKGTPVEVILLGERGF
jgi:molybdopterin molybdotransferase